ncbi:MAG: dihydropteroate synthase [Pseudomonadota bacterium]|nr:dihydropteroate synthase [Pseudomonadota bacterium]
MSVLFVTGRLARPRLEAVLAAMAPTFAYEILDIGVKVAALMTEPILLNRLPRPLSASRVILPGRCRADLDRLSAAFATRFERGPDEVKDLPAYFGKRGGPPDLSRHDLRIFAEIVDASALSLDALWARARALTASGADVIDLGCLPDTPFPLLEQAVRRLRGEGMAVSVDSADAEELRRGAAAGADYLLSMTEHTLDLAGTSRPILIPATHGDLDSLLRAEREARRRGLAPILDPILDPIHFGFTDSLARYRELRARLPEAEIMMGTGNLTELTEADSAGVTAMLLGICSELRIANALTVQVSPHTRRTVEEHDAARRLMFAAKADHSLPKGYGGALLQAHDRAPFPATSEEIAAAAREVKDDNFRIEVAADGLHVFNRRGHWTALDAFALFDKLGVERDGAHAFYLGAELQKAEIAYRLGKRYVQDEPLDWGVAVDRPAQDRTRLAQAGHTLRAKTGG